MTTWAEHCPRCDRITDHISDPQSPYAAFCIYCNVRTPVIGAPMLWSRNDPTLRRQEPVGFYYEAPSRWLNWLLYSSLGLLALAIGYAIIVALFL